MKAISNFENAQGPTLMVRFAQLNSSREWDAMFRMGSTDENTAKAVHVAWTHNARIIHAEEE